MISGYKFLFSSWRMFHKKKKKRKKELFYEFSYDNGGKNEQSKTLKVEKISLQLARHYKYT